MNRLINLKKPRIYRENGAWWCGCLIPVSGYSPISAYKEWKKVLSR